MAVISVSPQLSMPASADRELTRGRDIALHAAIFFLAFLVLFARRPDAILNAQFYAEDGKYWFAEAYNLGWHCLFLPVGGYLNSLSRLIGLLTLLFPLVYVPLVMNVCAIAFQILPLHVFLSSRWNSIPFLTRMLGGLLYLALPNSFEIHANTTNIQWHLALTGCLVLLGRQDCRRGWRIFDFLILALAVLDGPLGILLVPVALLLRWIRKDPRYNLAFAALLPPAVLQVIIMALSDSRRSAPNGASFARLTGILGGQVFLSSVLGVRTSIHLFFQDGVRYLFPIEVIATVVGLAFVIYALRFAPIELKIFYFFAGAVLALALRHPLASFEANFTQWELMQIPGCGNRYYFFPMLAFLATPIWMLTSGVAKSRFTRCSALTLILLLPIGICQDWRYKAFPDLKFKESAAEFERAAPGTQFTLRINPSWTMQLTKH